MSELKEIVKKEKMKSHLDKNENLNIKSIKLWKRNIYKSYFFHFFNGFHLISGVLLPFFLNWGRLTFVEVMFLQSYFTTMVLILEIPCGAVADYISRKFSLILGAFTTAIAALIYGSIPNIYIFMIGETLFAAGLSLVSGTDQAIIWDSLKKIGKDDKISKYMAQINGCTLAGITISAPLGSLIGYYLSLPSVMTFMFIPFFIASILGITLKEPKTNSMKKEKDNYFKVIKSGAIELVRNKILRVLAIDLVFSQSVVFFLIWTYQIYLDSMNFQMIFFGIVSAMMTGVQILFNNITPRIEQRIKKKKLFLQLYTLIPGIGFILMAVIFYLPISISLILVVIGFGFSRNILFIKAINNQIKSENRATVLSTINMMLSLIRTILYPLIGFLIMWNLSLTFIMLGVILVNLAVFTKIKDGHL